MDRLPTAGRSDLPVGAGHGAPTPDGEGPAAKPAGGPTPLDEVLPEVYGELRRIARRHLRRHAAGMTLNTTAVVHEAYLKLAAADSKWSDRGHLLAIASTAMRHLLVDAARRRQAAKRGAGVLPEPLETTGHAAEPPAAPDLLALDDALHNLAAVDPALVQVVECRFFAGLTVAETAEALGRSVRTVERDWARARGHLYRSLAAD
jgi:RNA polymerase sigma factor (TIGR02999 family)